VYTRISAYRDVDGDLVGAGTPEIFCTDGVTPASYSLQGNDCAPEMGTLWQLLAYSGLDEDGDGYTRSESGVLCSGESLPNPYRAMISGNDCNDRDPELFRFVVLYPDGDGDGIGAPPRSVPCLGVALPEGWSTFGYDFDDSSPAIQTDPDDELLLTIL
jgi:hypothetical protein